MTLDVQLAFKSPSAPYFPVAAVHRVEVRDALSELFEVVLHVASTELAPNLTGLLGRAVVVTIGTPDDPLAPDGTPRVRSVEGILRRVRQLTTVLPRGGASALYEVTVAPYVWLTTRRRARRIFQNRTVPEIVKDVLGAYLDMPAPYYPPGLGDDTRREYCAQYDETDWDFICRILSEEHLTTYFDHSAGSVFTLIDDPRLVSAAALPVRVAQSSGMVPDAPHVANVVPEEGIEAGEVAVRDYNFENPKSPPHGVFLVNLGEVPGVNEDDLEAYVYEERRLAPGQSGEDRARRLLQAMRVPARTFAFDASFAAAPGARLILVDNPTRADLDAEFLVLRLDVVLDDGDRTGPRAKLQDVPSRSHALTCIRAATTFCPPLQPRPRVHGTQTGFITGDGNPGTVEVDAYGRVKLELNWDRRDLHAGNPTRWTRVAQAWAGQGYGLVTLPRIGDEVVVDYIEGDPDNPIVIGRVHNAVQVTPLNLPVKDQALAVWRSRSFDADGMKDGYNQILMDDAAGAERLEIHAQRDFKSETGHDSVTTTGNDASTSVTGHSTNRVGGAYSLSAGSTTVATGPYKLTAKTVDETGQEHVQITSPKSVKLTSADAEIALEPGKISLTVGGSSITITPGSIDVTSKKVNITGDEVTVIGHPIKLNL